MKPIEAIATACIEEIRSGKANVDDCLARYPEMRRELEPLLRIAASIASPPAYNLEPAYKRSARASLLSRIAPVRRNTVSFADIISLGLPRRLAGARAVMATLVIVLLGSLAGGGTAYASQGTVPGDALYPVKIGTESIRLLAARNRGARAELNMEFAAERLGELAAVADVSEANAEAAAGRYRRNLEAAFQQLQKDSETPAVVESLDAAFSRIQSQVAVCDSLVQGSPAYLQPVVDAGALAFSGQVRILGMIARYDGLKATGYNSQLMQNRLQRALSTADAGNYRNMELELQRYDEFIRLGEQILDTAELTNQQAEQVRTITVQRLTADLETLESLSEQVPGEYRGAIDTRTRMMGQFQQRARHGQWEQGGGQGTGDGAGEGNGSLGPGPGGATGTLAEQGAAASGSDTPASTSSVPDGRGTPSSDNQTGLQGGAGPGGTVNGQGSGSGGPP